MRLFTLQNLAPVWGLLFVLGGVQASQHVAAAYMPPAQNSCIRLLKRPHKKKAPPKSSHSDFFALDSQDPMGKGFSTKYLPIDSANVLEAYSRGAFMWCPDSSAELCWYNPPRHGVVFLDHLFSGTHPSKKAEDAKINKNANKKIRQVLNHAIRNNWQLSINQNFKDVIRACASHNRPNAEHVWLTPEVQKTFEKLHKLGKSFSVEVWNQNGDLVGGHYGLYHDNVVSIESSFYTETYAGSASFLAMAYHVWQQGHQVLDVQVASPNNRAFFKARDIRRSEYLKIRSRAKKRAKHNPQQARALDHFPQSPFEAIRQHLQSVNKPAPKKALPTPPKGIQFSI